MDNIVVRQLLAHESEHDPINPERRGLSGVKAELVSGAMYEYSYSYERAWSSATEVFDDGHVRVEIRRQNGKRTVKVLLRDAATEVWWRDGSQVSVLPISASADE